VPQRRAISNRPATSVSSWETPKAFGLESPSSPQRVRPRGGLEHVMIHAESSKRYHTAGDLRKLAL